MRQSLMAGASSFAHLLGRGPKVAAAKPEDEQREGESDSDYEKRKKEGSHASAESDELEQGDDESDEDFEKRKKDAAEDKKDDDESEDEHKARVKANKAKRAKRARAEEDGDDDEEGDDGSDGADMRKKGARSARLRERARCSAIFADAAAGKNPALAAQLAFGTDLPRTQAINVLRAGGLAVASGPRRPSLDERMASVKVPVIGNGDAAGPTGAQGTAAQIIAAGKKRRGEV
jgi:hypothetical protein